MKKRLKRLLNNRGMSLVELIVAMFLTTVILAIAFGMLVPVKRLMNTVKSNAHMDAMCVTVDEYIRGTVQMANSLKFVVLEGNGIRTDDTDGVVEFLSGHSKVRAIAVLDTGAGETAYRIFDFGEISSYDNIKKCLNEKDEKEYGVFNPPFYEGTSCAVEFYNAGGKRLQVASQCYRNGEAINQKHVLSFDLLNGSVSGFSAINGTGEYTNVNIEEQDTIKGQCYLILYTLLDI